MPSQQPIPPLLSACLSSFPPSRSLTLLTSVLAASTNWLVLRFLYTALRERSLDDDGQVGEMGEGRVVLVSWLRSLEFWREGGRRLGVDFSRGGKVIFVDGLGGKFSGGARKVEKEILAAVGRQREGGDARVLVVLDGVDFLLAGEGVEAGELMDMVGEIREHVHAVIVTTSADFPLMQAKNTPLETNHAAFVMGITHQARAVLGIKGLETGAARDVSGVLRIGRGAGDEGGEVEEKEVLYFVGGDGGVRVFERGS